MYKLKDGFSCVRNKTLTGEKIIVGIKDTNSYILIKKDYEEAFYSLVNKLTSGKEIESLNSKERNLYDVFIKKGFFQDEKFKAGSFNEYNFFVKKIYEKKIENKLNIKNNDCKKKIFVMSYICTFLIGMIFLCENYITFMNIRLNIKLFTAMDLIVCLFGFPVILDSMHDFGHYFTAKMIGIQVDKVTIGFFVTWPTVFLQYKGLNLHKTWEKVCVASGGIVIHLINIVFGTIIYSLGIEHVVLCVWIIANMGMVIGNLMFLGPTDGYFILTSLLGIYNFRYIGYKTLCYCIYKKGNRPDSYGVFCGGLLTVLWCISFAGIYLSCRYYAEVFNIRLLYVDICSFIWTLLLIIRFILKIRKIN